MSDRRGERSLMFDGRKVADVELSGDGEADAEKCRQALKDLGLYKPTSELEAMHRQAHSFAICAIRIHDNLIQKERSASGFAPFVVNAAFAMEVYLKALTKVFGGVYPRKHTLEALLHGLPTDAQMALKMQIPFVIGRKGLTDCYDLAAILRELNTAFEDWRYIYEAGKKGTVHFDQTLYALRALHAASHSVIVSPGVDGCPL